MVHLYKRPEEAHLQRASVLGVLGTAEWGLQHVELMAVGRGFLKIDCGDVCTPLKLLKPIVELYTVNGWILCDVRYISIKLFLKMVS